MNAEELKVRTKRFAGNVIQFAESHQKTLGGNIICQQLIRSATSVGANYREACRARSRSDFISKIAIVESEADESKYCLELLQESRYVTAEEVEALVREADELTAIFTSSRLTAKSHS